MIGKSICKRFLGDRLIKKLAMQYILRKTKAYNQSGYYNSFFYRYAFAECGEGLRIYGNPLIQNPEKIHVGKNVSINQDAQINPNGEIHIGNNVTISAGVRIISNGLDVNYWREKRLTETVDHVGKPIYIADGTWLCANSIVLPGVSITGKGVIVAAGAVLTHDITEDFVVVAGVPGKIVKIL